MKRIAVNAAQPGEAGVFQPGDHPEHLGLCAVFHLGLEPHDVEQRTQGIVAPQLNHGMRFYVRLMRIGQAHRFHRTVAQGFASTLGHHLDRQAAIEIAGGFTFVKLGLVGGQQGVDERLVLIAVHRAVQIGGTFFLGLALVIA